MIEIAAAVKSATTIESAVGSIAKIAGKLKTQPDIAAQKLAGALGEIAKTLLVVDQATSEYLSLGIDEGALTKNSKLLLDIDGGSLRTQIASGRGHCLVIDNIYRRYLDKWFVRVLSPEEYASVYAVFQNLGNADLDLFKDMEELGTKLEREASAVLQLVVNSDEKSARALVLSAFPVLRPLRKAISNTMQTIYSLQGEFVGLSGSA